MKRVGLFFVVLFVGLASGCSRGGDSSHFAMEAAQGGLTEVQLGRLAAERASAPVVRQFGQQMVADHSKANADLQQIAARKSLQLPTAPKSEQQAEFDKLSQLSGADFDREYVAYMTEDHEEDAEVFEAQAQHGNDADIKAFAAKTLPVIQHHLQMIKDIKAKM
jgi:putative membrane protein